jgi:hypothetical protein
MSSLTCDLALVSLEIAPDRPHPSAAVHFSLPPDFAAKHCTTPLKTWLEPAYVHYYTCAFTLSQSSCMSRVYFTMGAENYNGWKTGADKAGACARHALSVGVKNPL